MMFAQTLFVRKIVFILLKSELSENRTLLMAMFARSITCQIFFLGVLVLRSFSKDCWSFFLLSYGAPSSPLAVFFHSAVSFSALRTKNTTNEEEGAAWLQKKELSRQSSEDSLNAEKVKNAKKKVDKR